MYILFTCKFYLFYIQWFFKMFCMFVTSYLWMGQGLNEHLGWLLLKVARRNIFFFIFGMLQDHVSRFLMFSLDTQYFCCIRYFTEELKWMIVTFVLIFVIWLAVDRGCFCCVTKWIKKILFPECLLSLTYLWDISALKSWCAVRSLYQQALFSAFDSSQLCYQQFSR